MSNNRPSWSIGEAAERCGVSKSTVRRYRESGRFPDAFKDDAGAWKIPLTNLLAVGWSPVDPESPPEPPENVAAERVRVLELELEVERTKRASAERIAAMAETHLEDMRRALRMLEGVRPVVTEPAPEQPMSVPTEPRLPEPANVPEQPVRRRWWNR